MKTGVLLWNFDQISAESISKFSEEVEKSGAHALWIPETWVRDASVQLAVAALATKDIRIGSAVFNLFSRTPGFLAQTSSEIDHLSKGRFDLGLGVSGKLINENWHSVSFTKSLTRTREVFDVLRKIFSGDRIDFYGETISLKGFSLRRKPLQQRIPLYLAANGPKNIKICGEIADGWIPFCVPFSRFKEAMAPLQEGLLKSGRKIGDMDVAPFIYYCTDEDSKKARNKIKPDLAFYIGAMGNYYHAQLTRWGYGKEANLIRDGWKKNGREGAADAMQDHLLEDLVVCGTIEEVKSKLNALDSIGITQPILRIPDSISEKNAFEVLMNLKHII
ncbi:MAG: LLM class flavin-dependent oxidoreductase [Nitrospinota bacterium]|nr:LLM class flavin-dependent oxidoreductase [Nitrospinota bacterium]